MGERTWGWPATMSVGQRLCLWEHLSTMGVWHKGKGMRREEGSLWNPTVESGVDVMLVSWHVLFELTKKLAEKSGPGSQVAHPHLRTKCVSLCSPRSSDGCSPLALWQGGKRTAKHPKNKNSPWEQLESQPFPRSYYYSSHDVSACNGRQVEAHPREAHLWGWGGRLSPPTCFILLRQFLPDVTSPDSMSPLFLAVCSFTWNPRLKGHFALTGTLWELGLTALIVTSIVNLYWMFWASSLMMSSVYLSVYLSSILCYLFFFSGLL